jgi:uncharacterized protein (TIRG00374 family)
VSGRAKQAGLKRLERVSFAVGVLLLCALLYRIGLDTLVRNISEAGWGLLGIFALHGFAILFNTVSWRCMLPPHSKVPVRVLAPMLVAGEAVNAVNPVAIVGGELVRASLLAREVPAPTALASVALAAMTQFVGQLLFVLSGLPVVLRLIEETRLQRGLKLLSALLVLLVVSVLFLAWSQTGLAAIKRRLDRFRWFRTRWLSLPERWRTLAGEALSSVRQRPGAFALSVAASFLAWQTGVVETLLILRLLREPVGWSQALAIEVLAVTIEGALFFVPAKMGTQEGGKVLIFLAMGLDPAKGFTLGFIRRIRELAWAAIGLITLASFQRSWRRSKSAPEPVEPSR